MGQPALAIGADFGTAGARAVLLDLGSGEELAVSEIPYRQGVIDRTLPEGGEPLPPDWALFDPLDYADVLCRLVTGVTAGLPASAGHVIGIGVDATSCSVVPVAAGGEPLCTLPAWRARRHAWPKLWKHHAAQYVADRLTEVARERGEAFLGRYGGRISSEWFFPKLIQIWLEDRAVYEATSELVEVTDWLVWYLTGAEVRSSGPAAYKAMWSPEGGLPGRDYFEQAFPGFGDPGARFARRLAPLGTPAGELRADLAERLGLPGGVVVAVGNVDSFVSFPGAGASGPGTYVMVVGTSVCDMVVAEEMRPVPGITGVARDGILPGYFGYEAGQAAVGDMLGWYLGLLGAGQGAAGPGFGELETVAAQLRPGETGLVALDWWNGNRSILGDDTLSAVVAGLTLQTTRADLYRCMLEAVAFGNQAVIDSFTREGVAVPGIVACGGIAEKSPLLMQMIADVSSLAVRVPASSHVPARGAALFGAVAAGPGRGGFADISQAAALLAPPVGREYRPSPGAHAAYRRVYALWTALHDQMGRGRADLLHELKDLRMGVVAQRLDQAKEAM